MYRFIERYKNVNACFKSRHQTYTKGRGEYIEICTREQDEGQGSFLKRLFFCVGGRWEEGGKYFFHAGKWEGGGEFFFSVK